MLTTSLQLEGENLYNEGRSAFMDNVAFYTARNVFFILEAAGWEWCDVVNTRSKSECLHNGSKRLYDILSGLQRKGAFINLYDYMPVKYEHTISTY